MEYGAAYYVSINATGYNAYYTTLNPTANDYTIVLTSSGAGANYSLVNTFEDLTWVLLPYTRSMTNTSINFTLAVISTNSSIHYFGLNLSCNGTLLFTQNDTTHAAGGVIYNYTNVTVCNGTNVTAIYWFSRSPDYFGEAAFFWYGYAANATNTFTNWITNDYESSGLSNVSFAIIGLLIATLAGAWVSRSTRNKSAAAIVIIGVLAVSGITVWLAVPIAIGGGAGVTISSWLVIGFTVLAVGSILFLRERI
jgi:predicted outer membrane repeat protein